MRAVVQRVRRASVTVDGVRIAAIETGLLALVGVTHRDDETNAAALARKLFGLRILHDEQSIADDPQRTAVLIVSQFTLYGDARKGRRPTWAAAAPGEAAAPLIEAVTSHLRQLGARVETGRFGAEMLVELANDGPFTVLLEV